MANSIITYTGNGVNTQFALNFTLGILDREHVKCRVGSEVDGLGDPVYRTLEWVTDGLVNVQGTVPANGQAVVFTRTVPKDELVHDYENGAAIEESNLDDSNKQSLMAIHEFLDGRLEGGFAQDLTMNGFKITDLGDGTDPEDAVNLAQLEDMTGNAPAYAAAAAASAAAALVSENNAETAETNAETAATLAQAWATNPEDDDVAGYAGEYSALHWAAKAAKAAASAALLPLNNYVATTAPTTGDDSGDGYSVGSRWVDTVTTEVYVCISAALGAAVWEQTTLTIDDLGSAATAETADFATAAQGALAGTALQGPKATQAQIEAQTADKFPDAAGLKYHSGVAKAWVKFNGTGTPAINASYNVGSITDVGTGDYLVNFTTNFSSINYVMSGSSRTDGGTGLSSNIAQKSGGAQSASQCQVSVYNVNGTIVDADRIFCAFFGDQ